MRITCPHCGTRDLAEFYYWGDASRALPSLGEGDEATWHQAIYERANPRGRHREHWQHLGGCRAFLEVERDTMTHEIFSVIFAREAKSVANTTVKTGAKK